MNTFREEQYGRHNETMNKFLLWQGREEAIKPELLKNAQTNVFNMQNPSKSTHTSRRKNRRTEICLPTRRVFRKLDENLNSPTFWSELLYFFRLNY